MPYGSQAVEALTGYRYFHRLCFWMGGKEGIVKKLLGLFEKVIRDESGGEVLEYALIAGLIVVAAIAVITRVGSKVLARWTSLNAAM